MAEIIAEFAAEKPDVDALTVALVPSLACVVSTTTSAPAIGESSPSGCSSSILVFGRTTNTVVTPCAGTSSGAETSAPSVSRPL